MSESLTVESRKTQWEERTLGEVCEIISGQSPNGNTINSEGQGVAFFQGKKQFKRYFLGNCESWTTDPKKFAYKNSILMSVRAPVGPVNISTEKISIGRGLASINAGSDINYKFLFYFLMSIKDSIKGNEGSTFSNINRNQISSIKIPYIHLEEQERIVDVLDKAFETIDKAIANTEANLASTKELFQSVLNDTFQNKGDDWEEKALGDAFDVRDGTHDSPKYVEEGFPLVTSKNLKGSELNFEKVKYISEKDFLEINKRSKVNEGDLLMAMIGTIGNPIVVPSDCNFAIKNVALFKAKKDRTQLLCYLLKSPKVISSFMRDAKGSTQKFVSLGYLRQFKVFMPNITVQDNLINKLDSLSTKTKQLEALYENKLASLKELKQSLLQKAFSGAL